MEKPQLVVNFKTYPTASGQKAVDLAKLCEKVANEMGVRIAVAAQAVDLRHVANEVSIPVLAQHFDLAEEGAFTGHITPHSLKEIGVYGSLLNHSERRLELDDIEESLDKARNLGLFTIVCADTAYTGKAVAQLEPHMVAVEPPELIGGNVSVCTANPQVLKDSIAMIDPEKVLVGAGIKEKQDVALAISHGAAGVLVSSGITTAADPESVLRELAEGVIEGRKHPVEQSC